MNNKPVFLGHTSSVKYTIFLMLLAWSVTLISQEKLEIDGKVKITMMTESDSDSIVVWGADRTLSMRSASSISEKQILSISNDTIYLSGGDFVKLPAEVDGDVTNEKMTALAIVGDSLAITEGGMTMKVAVDSSNTNEKITGFGIVGDSLYIKEGSMDTMKVALPTSAASSPWYLGQDTLGGIVFSIYKGQDGLDHGLIVDTMETTANWQNTGTLTGADRSWDGVYNTTEMSNSPAKDYVASRNTATSTTDWYLPSIDELSQLWHNRIYVNKALNEGNYTLLASNANYWSSTEYSASTAWAFAFSGGNSFGANESNTLSVRAIRAF